MIHDRALDLFSVRGMVIRFEAASRPRPPVCDGSGSVFRPRLNWALSSAGGASSPDPSVYPFVCSFGQSFTCSFNPQILVDTDPAGPTGRGGHSGEHKGTHPCFYGAWPSEEDRHLSENHIKMYNSRLLKGL